MRLNCRSNSHEPLSLTPTHIVKQSCQKVRIIYENLVPVNLQCNCRVLQQIDAAMWTWRTRTCRHRCISLRNMSVYNPRSGLLTRTCHLDCLGVDSLATCSTRAACLQQSTVPACAGLQRTTPASWSSWTMLVWQDACPQYDCDRRQYCATHAGIRQ